MKNRTTTRLPATPAVLVLLLFVVLGGCATQRGGEPTTDSYEPGSGYHQLMAEIAEQRGVQATAADEYLRAAEASEDPAVAQRATEFAYNNGFDAYALRAARRWAQLAPEEASAQLVIARLLIRRNDVAAATLAAERALGPTAERTGEDYLLLAGELSEEGGSEVVTRVLTRLAANAPDSAALRLAVGNAAVRSRDYDLALASARAAVAGASKDHTGEANALLGRALLASGDTEGALAHMAARAKADPTLETELEYASLLAAAERQTEALTLIEEIAERHGNEPPVRRLRALVSRSVDDQQTAWTEFGALATDSEFADESLIYLAEMALKQERFEQALQLFARVGGGPYLLTAQDAIARIAEAQGDRETVMQLWSRVAERYPQYALDADRYRASALQRLGEDAEALSILNQILRYRPDDAELLLARGALLEKMGRVDEGLADMQAVARLLPESAVALNAYGYTLANRTGRDDEARRLIRRAIEREPESAAIMDSYGWVLFKQGELTQARSWLQLAYAQFPDPEVAAHLGEVMWQQGEQEGARKLWQEALERDPESAPLKETLARFER